VFDLYVVVEQRLFLAAAYTICAEMCVINAVGSGVTAQVCVCVFVKGGWCLNNSKQTH